MTRPPDAELHDRVGAVVLATGVEQPDPIGQPFDPYWAVAGGKPLVAWSVAALAQTPEIDVLALVVAPERQVAAQALLAAEGWQAALVMASDGGLVGALRTCLEALPASCAWVVVHDAARPLVTPELVTAGLVTARRARASGAAGMAVAVEPVKETIKRVRDGVVMETLDRSGLALLHTPQVYARAALVAALSSAKAGVAASDMAALAHAAGVALVTYPGGPENLKVRTPDDLAVAVSLLERRERDISGQAREQGSAEGNTEKGRAS